MIRRGLQYILDAIFPRFCFGCGREEFFVCTDCLANDQTNLVLRHEQINKRGLHSLFFVRPYNESDLLGRIIHAIKYDFAESLAPTATSYLRVPQSFFDAYDVVLPVPLHRRRFAERGFNQSELLVNALREQYTFELCESIKRTAYTQQQARLSRKERLENVVESFSAHESMGGMKVLLVDDVYTTGATAQSLAMTLKKAGAGHVDALVLAKG